MRVGIIAALPGELKPLVRGWAMTAAKDGTRKWTHRVEDSVWVAVCSGMGANAARRAFVAAEAEGPLDWVLSVGWAGALSDRLRAGDAYVVSRVVDAQTGEQFQLSEERPQRTLVTVARVADEAEKIRLAATYSAAMVDMEAATVARMAQIRGIPVGCIKGVSDGVSARLPDLNRFLSPAGQLRMGPFLAHLAIRPKYWASIGQLARNSSKAALAIRDAVLEFMQEIRATQPNGKYGS